MQQAVLAHGTYSGFLGAKVMLTEEKDTFRPQSPSESEVDHNAIEGMPMVVNWVVSDMCMYSRACPMS